ncbi:hypothetical protein P170DRAFT_514640 [Aspergillus steynii IBT 23096]|uniref:Dickkopf N-terminal cysteine-rich domain-containing protein n=1 Tax=Aspergillus steynii IBT 23096 TaxID=1392250 RepID=A0A2I2FS20_9EURO|nr:uncharacterized protein P170DRAFT_514640 [Aspergillus steynii IBT 23096]PLB43425.1 hypothetical protein P170DRAFT_514640 [Aspergillus steynii IBT 23096]
MNPLTMKLYLLFLGLLVALVTAVAIPDPDKEASGSIDSTSEVANVLYPGQPCKYNWECPSSEHCSKKGRCTLNEGRCLKDKDCPKYMVCSDTHCFPHSRNDRRDSDDSTGSDEAEVVPDIQLKAPCVNNTDCSSNEVCSHGHCTLKTGRCWENRDCNRRQHCINTFCYPPDDLRRRGSGDELADTSNGPIPTPAPVDGSGETEVDETDAETADNMDVTPFEQDTLLGLVKTAANKSGNKCRRRCRYHTDCCPKDLCWNMRVCLGPH